MSTLENIFKARRLAPVQKKKKRKKNARNTAADETQLGNDSNWRKSNRKLYFNKALRDVIIGASIQWPPLCTCSRLQCYYFFDAILKNHNTNTLWKGTVWVFFFFLCIILNITHGQCRLSLFGIRIPLEIYFRGYVRGGGACDIPNCILVLLLLSRQ